MATCKKIPAPKPADYYELTLSETEAKFVRDNIDNWPPSGKAVYTALKSALSKK